MTAADRRSAELLARAGALGDRTIVVIVCVCLVLFLCGWPR